MSPCAILLYLALIALVYAVPPIVPVNPEPANTVEQNAFKKPLVDPQQLKFVPIHLEPVDPKELLQEELMMEEYAAGNGPCVDGVNNVIKVADVGDSLAIRTQDVVAHTYDDNFNPSCYNGRARVSLPGIIKVVKGMIIVTAPFNLTQSGEAHMTITKNSRIIGTVCREGVSSNAFVPKDQCRMKLYPDFDKELLDMLGTPGVYDMATIQSKAGMGAIIKLPPIRQANKIFVKGDWKTVTALVSKGKVIARVKAPSNGNWLYVN